MKKFGENVVIARDLNEKVLMKDIHYSVESKNGGSMLCILNDMNISILNFECKCQGKWTKVS